MTLPTSGAIGLGGVRAELGVGGSIDMNRTDVRTMAGILAGAISLSDFYGKEGPGSTSPLGATGNSDTSQGQANGINSFTATANPSVTVTGGVAPFSFQWTISTQSGGGFILTDDTLQQATVTHTIGKYGYIGSCSLTCEVSDSKGQSVQVTGIVTSFEYEYGNPR